MSLYQKIGKGGVNDLKKYLRKNPLTINSWVARLHSVLTVGLLGASTVILTLNSYVGEPIQCESGAESADKTHGNTFCWIYGPKTKDHTDGSCDHNHVFDLSQKDAEGWSVRSHQFYQWINLTLIMQALFFYLPGWIWTEMEGGEVEGVVGEKGLRPLGDVMTRPKEEVKKEAVKVAKKLLELQGSHRPWATRFVACELLSMLNLIAQFFFTNHFIGGGFLSLGLDLLRDSGCTPGKKLFPIRAACRQYSLGGAGKHQYSDLLCVLTTNMWNRKFYTFLHFWFVLLLVITIGGAFYRLCTILVPNVRDLVEKLGREDSRDQKHPVCTLWRGFSDWLFYSMVLTNCNSLMRDEVRVLCKDKNWGRTLIGRSLAKQATRDCS